MRFAGGCMRLVKALMSVVFLLGLCLLTGCHFVGDASSSQDIAGFFAGLWDGSVLLFSVVLTCFTDVQILDLHNSGFLYKVGYAIGVFCFAWNLGIAAGIISLLLYITPF